MANPQLEDGYTRIANEILEVVSKVKLNGTQYKILITIWRYTYGFNRKDSEFSLNFLSEATNSNKQQVKRELDRLIESKVISVVEKADFNSSRRLSFNKKYSEWKVKGVQSVKKDTVSEFDYSTVSEKAYSTVSGLAYQERQYKDNIKKNTTTVITKEQAEDKSTNPVARVGADPTKQDSPVQAIENYYLKNIKKRNLCSSKDMVDIVHAYEQYQDLEFILNVLKIATKENKARNGKITINSFKYFLPILEEEWKNNRIKKEGAKAGTIKTGHSKNIRFDKSKFLYKG